MRSTPVGESAKCFALGSVGQLRCLYGYAEVFVKALGVGVRSVRLPFEAAAVVLHRDLGEGLHDRFSGTRTAGRLADVQLLEEQRAGEADGRPKKRVCREADRLILILNPGEERVRRWRVA